MKIKEEQEKQERIRIAAEAAERAAALEAANAEALAAKQAGYNKAEAAKKRAGIKRTMKRSKFLVQPTAAVVEAEA